MFRESFKRRGGFSGGGVGTPKEVCLLFADVILPLSTEIEGFRALTLTGLLFLALPTSFCFNFFPPAFPGPEGLFRGIDFDLPAALGGSFLLGLATFRGLVPILFLPAETPVIEQA